jgi:hypothetical protein
VGKPEGKDRLKDPGIGESIILRCTSGRWNVGAGTCKCGDEASDSMKEDCFTSQGLCSMPYVSKSLSQVL